MSSLWVVHGKVGVTGLERKGIIRSEMNSLFLMYKLLSVAVCLYMYSRTLKHDFSKSIFKNKIISVVKTTPVVL